MFLLQEAMEDHQDFAFFEINPLALGLYTGSELCFVLEPFAFTVKQGSEA